MERIDISADLLFQSTVTLQLPPTVVLRSLIGMVLHQASCGFKNQACSSCVLQTRCPYGVFFEPKNKGKGLSGVSPILFQADGSLGERKSSLKIRILGFVDQKLDFIDWEGLLKLAGTKGFQKERVRFEVANYVQAIRPIFPPENYSNPPKPNHGFRIEFATPFRTQEQGQLVIKPSYLTLLKAAVRRVGDFFPLDSRFSREILETWQQKKRESSHMNWEQWAYFSTRQKASLNLAGALGFLDLQGEIDDLEWRLLHWASEVHVGKNLSFGLGRYKILGG